jgi:hypothetical protein
MRYFLIKLILLLLPVMTINLCFILNGVLFSEKNDHFIRSLIRHAASGDQHRVVFFGSSRINTGISGTEVLRGMGQVENGWDIVNLGLDGKGPAASLSLLEATGTTTVPEVSVVEVMPGINPMNNACDDEADVSLSSTLEGFLGFWFNKGFVLHKGIPLIKIMLGSSATKYHNCHPDGWTEIRYYDCPVGLHNARETWASFARKNVHSGIGAKEYNTYAGFIRGLKTLKGSRLVFLIMPVDGPVLVCQDSSLAAFDPFPLLKAEFPEALFINANKVPLLKLEPTYEYSHLASAEAARFSGRLGKVLADSLRLNQYAHPSSSLYYIQPF